MDLKHVINQTSNSAELILYGQVGYDFDCNEVAQEMDFLSQMGVKNIKLELIQLVGVYLMDFHLLELVNISMVI